MGRPIFKINKEKLKYLIENSGKSISEQSRELGLDRATVHYYRKKLKNAGFQIGRPKGNFSELDIIIHGLKKEYGLDNKKK